MSDNNYGGLSNSMDLSNVNTYGLDDDRIKQLQEAQQTALTALQQRYQNPNWFKVAAGFAKPQLGGFTASLGSAAEALGENVENDRAQQLPIAQLKMQMAQSNLLLGQNKKASDMVAERRDQGLPITPEFAAEVARIAPNSSVAKALATEIGTQQKTQELAGQRVNIARSMGRDPNPADMQLLSGSTAPTSPPSPGQGMPQQMLQQNTVPAQQMQGGLPEQNKVGNITTDSFLNATHSLEGMTPGQKSKTSSAVGPGGMIDSTRNAIQQKYNLPDGYGTDPAITSQYENALLKENSSYLKNNNLDDTALNHRAAWWFGGDAPKLLNADPATKLSDVLPQNVIKANGLNGGVPVGKLLSRIEGNLWDQGVNPKSIVGDGSQNQQNQQGKTDFKNKIPLDPSDPSAKNMGFNDWGFSKIPANATYNEFTKNQWAEKEKSANERVEKVSQFGSPESAMQTSGKQNISQLLDYAQQSPENRAVIANVVNNMNKFPAIGNAIVAAADQGFHGNFGSLSGSIGLPMQKFLNNLHSPEEQKVAQMVVMAIDNANFANAKLKGMNATGNMPASEANLLTAGTISQNTNPATLLHTLSQVENNLDMYKDLHNGYQVLSSKYGDQLNPVAANHQIVNSDWWKQVVGKHKEIADEYSKQYSNIMSPKNSKKQNNGG